MTVKRDPRQYLKQAATMFDAAAEKYSDKPFQVCRRGSRESAIQSIPPDFEVIRINGNGKNTFMLTVRRKQ
jgi:hypothetical protein